MILCQLTTNEKNLTHIDLFSGIGGFTLAGEWAGFKTVTFCEKERFCQKILKKYWPEVPIIEEIRDFDGTKWRGATLLTGGFPCQPFSVAGQRRGKEDDRYLWPEMLRVISEAGPRWILAENVPGIFRMALDTVLADLESEGYTTGTFIIPACGLDAPHRRNRVWIVAHTRKQKRNWLSSIGRQKMAEIGNKDQNAQNAIGAGARNKDGEIDDQKRRTSQDRRKSIRQEDGAIGSSRTASTNSHAQNAINDRVRRGSHGDSRGSKCTLQAKRSNSHASDSEGRMPRKQAEQKRRKNSGRRNIEIAPDSNGFNGNNAGFNSGEIPQQKKTEIQGDWQEDWYEIATRFCRVDDGVSDRIHRLKALGNAIVPQVAYEILKNIAWIENELAK